MIDELQTVIDETQATIDRFEASGMSESMPEDDNKLLSILDSAIKQQREHTQGCYRVDLSICRVLRIQNTHIYSQWIRFRDIH